MNRELSATKDFTKTSFTLCQRFPCEPLLCREQQKPSHGALESVQKSCCPTQCIGLKFLMGSHSQWPTRSKEPPVEKVWEPLLYENQIFDCYVPKMIRVGYTTTAYY